MQKRFKGEKRDTFMKLTDPFKSAWHALGLSKEARDVQRRRWEWRVEYKTLTPKERKEFDKYFEAAKRIVSQQVDIPIVVESKARYLAKAMIGKLPKKEMSFFSETQRQQLKEEAAKISLQPKAGSTPKKRTLFTRRKK